MLKVTLLKRTCHRTTGILDTLSIKQPEYQMILIYYSVWVCPSLAGLEPHLAVYWILLFETIAWVYLLWLTDSVLIQTAN